MGRERKHLGTSQAPHDYVGLDRVLHADLLRSLLKLARSADNLHGLRAQVSRRGAAGRLRPD